MNHSDLLRALMTVPEPVRGMPTTIAIGVDFTAPIHNAPHCRRAIESWPRYSFSDPAKRRAVALRIAQQAVKLAIVVESLRIVRGK